jgi:hypothetical protein
LTDALGIAAGEQRPTLVHEEGQSLRGCRVRLRSAAGQQHTDGEAEHAD